MTLQSYRTEYVQANELYRHYQRLQLAALALFILAFVVLALTWTITQLYLLLLACLVSVAVFLAWFNLNLYYARRTAIVAKTIYELEEILGLSLYKRIRAARKMEKNKGAYEQSYYIPEISIVVLVILWVVRLFLAIAK